MDKDQELTKSPSTNEGYAYFVQVDITNEFFKSDSTKEIIFNFGEMVIESDWFADHRECQEDAAQLLISFANQMRAITGRRYVIATKMNPLHDETSRNDGSFAPWDESMVMKMYLTDAARLRADNMIDSSIMVTVKSIQRVDLDSIETLIPQ